MRPLFGLIWPCILACAVRRASAQIGNEDYLGTFTDDGDTAPNYVDVSPTITQDALQSLYKATGGAAWTNATGWEDYTVFVCSYFGVTCYPMDYVDQRRAGQVQAIELPENNLAGPLPGSIFTLPYLEKLVVRGNPDLKMQLNDENNMGFEQAKFLKVLDISSTSVESLAGIEQATQLEQLYITSLQLGGTIPSSIFQLWSLRGLYANYNGFTGSLSPEIGSLASLEELYLSANDLIGQLPSSLGSLSKLSVLALGQNSFGGSLPTELNQLTELEILALHRIEGEEKGTGISYKLPSFANLSKLSELYLQNQQITGTIPSDFIQSASDATTIVVNLSGNNLGGGIPPTLASKQRLNLYLGNNLVKSLSDEFCAQVPGWMDGDVENAGCSAILCPPGTWAPKGRATDGDLCETCGSAFLWGTTYCAADVPQGDPVNQRDVLTLFYESMGGRYWTRSDKWTTDAPVCEWEGITCNDSINVSELVLQRNGLAQMGAESPWKELFKLPELEILDLSSNAITFSFDGIASATALRVLVLSNTELKSTDGLEQLSSINIVQLSLASNRLKGQLPESLFRLTALEELDLSLNAFSGPLSNNISLLGDIKRLDISGNRLTGAIPATIGGLTKLYDLQLSDNKFSGPLPAQISNLVNLQDLSLSQNRLSGALPAFGDLSELTSLRLGDNALTGALPEALLLNTLRGKNAIELQLNDNLFSGEIPSAWSTRFAKLLLDLSNNRITSIGAGICSKSGWMGGAVGELGSTCDAILCPAGTYNEFGRRTNTNDSCEDCSDAIYMGSTTCDGNTMGGEIEILRAFYLSTHGDDWSSNDGWTSTDNYCSWYGITCDSNRKVARIVLESNGLYGPVGSSLFALPELVELNLAKNDVVVNISGLAAANNLQILNVSRTGLDSLEGISKASHLAELYADENAMPGYFPAELLTLTSLVKLHLNYNMYSGRIPASISTLANLQELSLFHNRLTGELPGALGSLSSLRILALSENNFIGSLPTELNNLSNLEVLAIQREGGTDGTAKDIGINQERSEDAGPGLTGRILSFNGLPKLRELYLGVNSLSGALPVDFLDGVEDKSALIQVDLTLNDLVGTVPSSLARFDQMTLYLAGNMISAIAEGICRQSAWMNGEVGRLGCAAIMCEAGTFNKIGRAAETTPCTSCDDGEVAKYYGSFQCLDAADQRSWDDRQILIDLYKSTDGGSWTNSDGWLDDDISICDWFGITCTEGGSSVKSIRLEQNGLRGNVPRSIYALPRLRDISFAKNDISFSFSGIATASSLVYVDLDSTGLQSLQGIESASGLEVLSVASNDFKNMFPDAVFSLTNLQYLELSDNLFNVYFPIAFGKLLNLESLSCSRCGLVGTLPSNIGSLQALTSLKLEMNTLYGSLPTSFGNLQLLSVLDLSNQLYNSDVMQGAQAGKVGFGGTLDVFSNLTQASELHLQNNRFTSSIPSTFLLKTAAESLRVVDLRGNALTGSIPTELSRFLSPQILLADNMIQNLPQEICSLPWNGKSSAAYNCDHILCNIGSSNGLGYATDSIPCIACPGGFNDSPYFGGTSCGPDMERDILDQLFMELNGDEWINRDGWYAGAETCRRYGVACDSKGLVLALELPGNQLRGVVTPRIWQLTRMVELDLSNNEVEVSFQSIAALDSLKSLILSGTNTRTLDHLGGATTLTSLHLENNLLSGPIPDQLYKLTNLESLYVDHNQLTGSISSSIGNLAKLQEVSLSENKLSGSLENLQLLPKLRAIALGRNNFSGTIPKFLSSSQNLELLNLQGATSKDGDGAQSGLSGPLPSFSGTPRLRELNLASNTLSGTIPRKFLDMVNPASTASVNLDNNRIIGGVPTTLTKFSDLRISLAGNLINDVPESICSMSNWMGGLVGTGCDAFLCMPDTYNTYGRRLPNENCEPCNYRGVAKYYGSTFCGSAFPKSLSQFEILSQFWAASNGREWTNLKGWTTSPSVCEWYGITCGIDDSGREVVTEINLASNNLQWDALSVLFYLPKLRVLNLANNDVNLVLTEIHNAASLEELAISGTRVKTLKGIGGAKKLKILRTARNAFYGAELLDELYSLTDLIEVDISSCGFVGSLSPGIESLANLEEFNAANNDLTGQLPGGLFRLGKLKRLILSGNNFIGEIPLSSGASTSLEILAIDARKRSTAGLSGPLPAFANMTNLKILDLGSNSLTGSIPDDFISSVRSNGGTITVRLDGNVLTGDVPTTLRNIVNLNLDLSDNEIETVSSELCTMTNWADGDVGRYGCDGLLCPARTYSAIGRQSSDQIKCDYCPGSTSPYLGQTVCPSVQKARNREILERLFDTTNGRKWNRNDGWKESDDICEWFGVTCAGADDIEIESIDLGSNNLVGRLPSEIFQLPGLGSLSFSSNPIDFRFDGIELAESLTSLQLDSIGLRSLQGIGKATRLVELLIRFNNFQGGLTDELSKLTNLETFYCGDSSLTGRLPTFDNNRKLSALRLGGNAFTGALPSFDFHPRLRTLDVSDNQLTGDIPDDLLAASDVSKPIFLDLSNNELSGNIPDSLLRFPMVTIFARDNKIDSINPKLCSMDNWNEGDVDLYQCDGILCPPFTFSPRGRASEGEACIYCGDAPYYGSSSCPNAVYGESAASSTKLAIWAATLLSAAIAFLACL
ncbi:hypothetical protein MPSEU_000951400 [Mayamaea pseudoterrestris]|nr:hypothetical protein MPSEU_000951400 [Mayamaea pseudoterrestris]